jgi:2-dehydro-3-deoxy-D-gluconate 5-dehydrogenase
MNTPIIADPVAHGREMSAQRIADLLSLEGKVAIVTGGASGIGRACAVRLAEAAASVLIADLNEAGAQETALLLGSKTASRCAVSKTDVRLKEQTESLVERALAEFGRVDVLVNAAGIFPPAFALEIEEAAWDSLMGTNLRGMFFLSQAVARHMVATKRGGSIVNIASMNAYLPNPTLSHYDASKAGVVGLTQSLAREWGEHRIRVNAVAPGNIYTPGALACAEVLLPMINMTLEAFRPRTVLNRWGQPDDMARVVLFLASPLSSFVTGTTVLADGGATLV